MSKSVRGPVSWWVMVLSAGGLGGAVRAWGSHDGWHPVFGWAVAGFAGFLLVVVVPPLIGDAYDVWDVRRASRRGDDAEVR